MNICGILYVNLTCTDGHMRRHLGQLPEIQFQFSLNVMMLHNALDTVVQLNVFQKVK